MTPRHRLGFVLVMLGLLAPLAFAQAPGAPTAPAPKLPSPAQAAAAAQPAHGGFVEDLDCSACHTAEGWQLAGSSRGSGFDHDRTGFPLRHAHAASACGGCHTQAGKPANTCAGCHRDPHRGDLGARCEECHRPTAWTDTQAMQAHQRTRMPLTGAHALTECSNCHVRTTERTFAAVPTDCYGCHRSAYHQSGIHPVHDGSSGEAPFSRQCDSCHRPTSWSPAFADPSVFARLVAPTTLRLGGWSPVMASLAARLDHDRWFAISQGAHAQAACTSCHVDPRRMTQARCDGCHAADVLRRQHGRAVSGTCLACHPRGGVR